MSKTVKKQSKFAHDPFVLNVRITTATESYVWDTAVTPSIVYDGERDVSKIVFSDSTDGESGARQKDEKTVRNGYDHAGKRDPLKQYMDELSRIPRITQEQEIELAGQIHSSDPKLHDEAFRTMLLSNLRLVVKIAHDFRGFGLPLLDLISEGNIGLAHAVERFDPKFGAKFSSYAAWWIKQAMRRAWLNQSGMIRIPVQVVSQIAKIKTAVVQLGEKLGRSPSDAEIAAELGMEERRVSTLRLADLKTISIYSPIKDGEDGSLGDLIADNNTPGPDEIIGEQETSERLTELVKQLDERELRIVVARFGLDGKPPRTLDELSRQFGRTRERVRQIQKQALCKLRDMLEDKERFVA